jgi:hypothetical protein
MNTTDSISSKKNIIYRVKKFSSNVLKKFQTLDKIIVNMFDTDNYGPEDGQYMGFNRYPHNRSKNRPRSERELRRLNNMGLHSKRSYNTSRVAPSVKKSN